MPVFQLILVEERRWPLGNKITEINAGVEGGFISCIKWKDSLIAWCNSESQVKPYSEKSNPFILILFFIGCAGL